MLKPKQNKITKLQPSTIAHATTEVRDVAPRTLWLGKTKLRGEQAS